LPEVVKVTQI